jgi:hypothetical protein
MTVRTHTLHTARTRTHSVGRTTARTLASMQRRMEPPGVRFRLSKGRVGLTATAHNFFYPYRPTCFGDTPNGGISRDAAGLCLSSETDQGSK